MTDLRKEYNKNKYRIKRFTERWNKKGVIFNPDITSILNTSKTDVSKSDVEYLQSLTRDKLISSAKFLDESTGQLYSLELQGKHIVRKAPLISEDDLFLNNFQVELNRLREVEGYETLKNWFDNLFVTRTKEQVAEMLRDGFASGVLLNWRVVYKKALTLQFISEMLDYLPDITFTEKLQMFEDMDVYDYEGYF